MRLVLAILVLVCSILVVLLACRVTWGGLGVGSGAGAETRGVGPSAVGGGLDVGTANRHLGRTSAVGSVLGGATSSAGVVCVGIVGIIGCGDLGDVSGVLFVGLGLVVGCWLVLVGVGALFVVLAWLALLGVGVLGGPGNGAQGQAAGGVGAASGAGSGRGLGAPGAERVGGPAGVGARDSHSAAGAGHGAAGAGRGAGHPGPSRSSAPATPTSSARSSTSGRSGASVQGSYACWGPGLLLMAAVPLLVVLVLLACLGLGLHHDVAGGFLGAGGLVWDAGAVRLVAGAAGASGPCVLPSTDPTPSVMGALAAITGLVHAGLGVLGSWGGSVGVGLDLGDVGAGARGVLLGLGGDFGIVSGQGGVVQQGQGCGGMEAARGIGMWGRIDVFGCVGVELDGQRGLGFVSGGHGVGGDISGSRGGLGHGPGHDIGISGHAAIHGLGSGPSHSVLGASGRCGGISDIGVVGQGCVGASGGGEGGLRDGVGCGVRGEAGSGERGGLATAVLPGWVARIGSTGLGAVGCSGLGQGSEAVLQGGWPSVVGEVLLDDAHLPGGFSVMGQGCGASVASLVGAQVPGGVAVLIGRGDGGMLPGGASVGGGVAAHGSCWSSAVMHGLVLVGAHLAGGGSALGEVLQGVLLGPGASLAVDGREGGLVCGGDVSVTGALFSGTVARLHAYLGDLGAVTLLFDGPDARLAASFAPTSPAAWVTSSSSGCSSSALGSWPGSTHALFGILGIGSSGQAQGGLGFGGGFLGDGQCDLGGMLCGGLGVLGGLVHDGDAGHGAGHVSLGILDDGAGCTV